MFLDSNETIAVIEVIDVAEHVVLQSARSIVFMPITESATNFDGLIVKVDK